MFGHGDISGWIRSGTVLLLQISYEHVQQISRQFNFSNEGRYSRLQRIKGLKKLSLSMSLDGVEDIQLRGRGEIKAADQVDKASWNSERCECQGLHNDGLTLP